MAGSPISASKTGLWEEARPQAPTYQVTLPVARQWFINHSCVTENLPDTVYSTSHTLPYVILWDRYSKTHFTNLKSWEICQRSRWEHEPSPSDANTCVLSTPPHCHQQTSPSLRTCLLVPHAPQRQQGVENSGTHCPDCINTTFKCTRARTLTHTHTLSWGKTSASWCLHSRLIDSYSGASQDYPHLYLIITIKLLSLTLIAGIWTDNYSSRHELLFCLLKIIGDLPVTEAWVITYTERTASSEQQSQDYQASWHKHLFDIYCILSSKGQWVGLWINYSKVQVWTPDLPLICCVTLGKLLCVSEPWWKERMEPTSLCRGNF